MTATGHAVIGTVIAAKIGNPALAIPIAIASHVVADMFPHWDVGVNRDKKSWSVFFQEAVIDVLTGFIVTFLLIQYFFPATNIIYALVIVIAAQLLDWLTVPYLFFKIKKPSIFYMVYKFQKIIDRGEDTLRGKFGQIAVLVILVVIARLI
jgi:hypothetical protein